VDAPGNALPSLHVATALFTALWIQRLLREIGAPADLRHLNWLWLALIVYSTLATKQHLALDVLAGGALGALFGRASLRWFPRVH
jgi:membrane-associated phospholipid phosphatase